MWKKGEYTPGGKTTRKKSSSISFCYVPFFQGQNEREAAGWRKRERERETLSFPTSSSLFAPPPLSSPLTPFRGSGERGIFRNAQEQKYRKAPSFSFCRIVRLSLKKCARKKAEERGKEEAIGLFLLASTLVLVSPSLLYSLSFRGGRVGRKGRRFPPPPILQNRRRGREEKTKGLNFTS